MTIVIDDDFVVEADEVYPDESVVFDLIGDASDHVFVNFGTISNR